MTRGAWPGVYKAVLANLAPTGLDLLAPSQVGRYNAAVDPVWALPELGHPWNLVLLVGNSRALWRPFVAWLSGQSEIPWPDPLERYVEACVEQAVAALGSPLEVRFAHRAEPAMVDLQTLARISGLAALAPARLSVHLQHGSWIGLRAAIVMSIRGPAQRAAATAPCAGCEGPCEAPFSTALRRLGAAERYHQTVERSDSDAYLDWVAFRDACPVGRASRYSDPQIRYHYTRDRRVLEREVVRFRAGTAAVSVEGVLSAWDWRELPGCPGRRVLRGAPRVLCPMDLTAGARVVVRGHAVEAAPDVVLVTWLPGGGLISYLRGEDATYVHTLNNPEGFRRKLSQLGIDH